LLLGYSRLYAPDAIEAALPDAASARQRWRDFGSDIPARLQAICDGLRLETRLLDAAVLACTRLGLRHGRLGNDFHAYHNEEHVLEVGERRLARVLEALGPAGLPAEDAGTLLLFACGHDLRQRETVDVPGPVGGNEAASVAEMFRVLDACGFDRGRDRRQFLALELMIAGSTFDSRPAHLADPHTEDLPALAGGALARGMALWLDSEHPHWRDDADARRGERLGRLAADLDTANVGEDYPLLASTAVRLCREREMRSGRSLDQAASAAACLGFLGPGQHYYFFELHHFCSREGERVFGPGKQANAANVRQTTEQLQARFASAAPADGNAVIAAYSDLTGAI
jgi:hypothetical protein